MKVENVECHIAQAQLRRLAGGEDLPEDLYSELERHLSVCPDCLAEAQRLRNGVAGNAETPQIEPAKASPVKAILERVKSIPNFIQSPLATLRARLIPTASQSQSLINEPGQPLVRGQRLNLRVALTSGALALTLIAMSTILRDPTRFLGSKVAEKTPPVANEKTEEKEPLAINDGEEHDPQNDLHHETTEQPEPDTAPDHHDEPTSDPHAAGSATEPGSATHSASNAKPVQPPTERGGLSLPGRATFDDAPLVKADSEEGVIITTTEARRSTTSSTPRRSNTPQRRPTSQPRRSSSTPAKSQSAGSGDKAPVTVYLPNGQKKNP